MDYILLVGAEEDDTREAFDVLLRLCEYILLVSNSWIRRGWHKRGFSSDVLAICSFFAAPVTSSADGLKVISVEDTTNKHILSYGLLPLVTKGIGSGTGFLFTTSKLFEVTPMSQQKYMGHIPSTDRSWKPFLTVLTLQIFWSQESNNIQRAKAGSSLLHR